MNAAYDHVAALDVGIDAGGTSCKLLAVSVALDAPFALVGPAANVQRLGAEAAADVMADLIEQVCRATGQSGVRAVCAGMAGAGQQGDQQAVAARLRVRLGQGVRISIIHDAALALEAAFASRPGILVIAGTGSIVFARDIEGRTLRAGGWGYLFSDEGSGHALGADGLRAVAADYDGGPPTRLRALLAERHDLTDQEAIIHAVYRDGWAVPQMAPLVIEAASDDLVARQILNAQTAALALRVRWLTARTSPMSPAIALWGGLTKEPMYRQALEAALRDAVPGCMMVPSTEEPVEAALRLAKALR